MAITGLFLWDHIKMPVISLKSEVMQCLVRGIVALMNETPVSKKKTNKNILFSK